MLTSELVRVSDDGKRVEPRYLKLDGKKLKGHLERAEGLIELFRAYIGQTRAELEDAVGDLVGDGTDFGLSRGLTKLLEDRSVFDTVAPMSPEVIREAVFAASAAHHPVVAGVDRLHKLDREGVLALAVEALRAKWEQEHPGEAAPKWTTQEIDHGLYADLDDRQVLLEFKPLEPMELLERYNVALAQAVLFKATELRVKLREVSAVQARQLFRYLKFYQLMHRVRKLGSQDWELILDGPMSLINHTTKYGLQMAMFLPALLRVPRFEVEADLRWGPERAARTFQLTEAHGLVSHYPDKGTWITEEQQHLEDRLAQLKAGWKVSRQAELVDLGGRDVLSPDLTLTAPDGRVALVEIVGFWRKAWLKAKAESLARFGPSNLLLIVSDRLQADEDLPPELGVSILPFKGVILPKKVLELADKIAK